MAFETGGVSFDSWKIPLGFEPSLHGNSTFLTALDIINGNWTKLRAEDRKTIRRFVQLNTQSWNDTKLTASIQKIIDIAGSVLWKQIQADVNTRVKSCFAQFSHDKVPSVAKLKHSLREMIFDIYQKNYKFVSFNNLVHISLEQIAKTSKSNKMKVVLEIGELLSLICENMLDRALSPETKKVESLTSPPCDPIDLLTSLRSSVHKGHFVDKVLIQKLHARVVDYKKNLSTIAPPDQALSAFSQKIKALSGTVIRLNFDFSASPNVLQDGLFDLLELVGDKFLISFEVLHQQIKHNGEPSPLCMENLVSLASMLVSLQCTLGENEKCEVFRKKFEATLFKEMQSFNEELLIKITQSSHFNDNSKTLAHAILDILKFLDGPNKDFSDLVECFDKIYIHLGGIGDPLLNDSTNPDFVVNTLLEVLKGCIGKAICEFQQSAKSKNINLEDPTTAQLKQRLEIMLDSISEMLHCQISLKLIMAVEEDELMAKLYHLFSSVSGGGEPTFHMIKEWIASHPSYEFAKFQQWLTSKIKNGTPFVVFDEELGEKPDMTKIQLLLLNNGIPKKAVVVVKNDCDLIYSQFLAESKL